MKTTHRCYAPGCERNCATQYLMCRPHWVQVPRPLCEAIYDTVGNVRSPEYMANVREAQWIVGEKAAARAATKEATS